jgi:hypothetical protein
MGFCFLIINTKAKEEKNETHHCRGFFSDRVFAVLFPCQKLYSDIIPINLNDFYKDPSVVIGPGISSATMSEDPALITVLLSNDPFFGDPGIPVPLNLLTMSFAYSFTEPINNDDNF